MRISVSQLKCALRCGREWAFKYILKYPDPPSDALLVGRVFHELAEGKALSSDHLKNLPNDYPWGVYFRRMLAAHQVERRKYPPSFLKEMEYEKEDDIKLIVDEIAMEKDGGWWIVENKTAGQKLGIKARMLQSDLQLGLYSAYRRSYAAEWFLDPDKYQGCVYLVTYKPMERRKTFQKNHFKRQENLKDFGERLTSSSESVVVTEVDEKGALACRDYGRKVIDYISNVYAKSNDWRAIPPQSEGCIRYGKPCPYFTNCHGRED